MKTLDATYTVVTPMFLGGANPADARVGFRPPSFKGALRFWWRALVWGEIAPAAGDAASALRELHQREAALFGSAAGEAGSRQSRVLLSAEWKPGGLLTADQVQASGPRGNGGGIAYLMGQGLGGRSAAESGKLTVRLTFRPGTREDQRESVERALLVLGLLGGLGSRARRGFGSLAISELGGDRLVDLAVPSTVAALERAVPELLGDRNAGRPPFSAFSQRSRIDVSLRGDSATGVLAAVGSEMQAFRQSLGDDTRRARQAADGDEPDQPPERSIFGLPLQFYFKEDGATVFVEPATRRDEKIDRRASPLLIHVHHFPGEPPPVRFAAVQTFLPAVFLPAGKGIRVKAKGGGTFPFSRYSPPEELIGRYLDVFTDRRTVLS